MNKFVDFHGIYSHRALYNIVVLWVYFLVKVSYGIFKVGNQPYKYLT